MRNTQYSTHDFLMRILNQIWSCSNRRAKSIASNQAHQNYKEIGSHSSKLHTQTQARIHDTNAKPNMVGPIRTSTSTSSSSSSSRNHASSSSSSSSSASSASDRPLSGVFGLEKPPGPTSMSLLDSLKPLLAKSVLFRNKDGSVPEDRSSHGGNKRGRKFRGKNKDKPQPPKIGQGGTLDPLADGVLVVGVGKGTKQLARFLDCTKEYRAIGLLGTATTSYDSQDPILYRRSYSHVNPTLLSSKLPLFTGEIQQLPPLYSAIRMDGMRLFDYARKGIPLPRPIEKRSCRVEELRLVGWKEAQDHSFKEPEREVEEEEKKLVGRVRELAGEKGENSQETKEESPESKPKQDGQTPAAQSTPQNESRSTDNDQGTDQGPPIFTVEMTVSSGTYVRSIVHDLASACDSAAHVVCLTRTRQGEFSIAHEKNQSLSPSDESRNSEEEIANGKGNVAIPGNCIPWKVFEDAIQEMEQEEREMEAKKGKKEQLAGVDPEEEEEAAMNSASAKKSKTGEFQRDENGDFVLKEWEKLLLSRIVPC